MKVLVFAVLIAVLVFVAAAPRVSSGSRSSGSRSSGSRSSSSRSSGSRSSGRSSSSRSSSSRSSGSRSSGKSSASRSSSRSSAKSSSRSSGKSSSRSSAKSSSRSSGNSKRSSSSRSSSRTSAAKSTKTRSAPAKTSRTSAAKNTRTRVSKPTQAKTTRTSAAKNTRTRVSKPTQTKTTPKTGRLPAKPTQTKTTPKTGRLPAKPTQTKTTPKTGRLPAQPAKPTQTKTTPKTGRLPAQPAKPQAQPVKNVPIPQQRPKTGPAAAQPVANQPKVAEPKVVSNAPGLKVDHSFIKKQEAMKYSMYVPKKKDGTVLGKSGATIANGLDLGQRTHLNDLKKNGLSADVAAKLQPYLGMKKADAAAYVKSHPLTLSKAEGDHLASVVSKTYDQAMASSFNKVTKGNFSNLPSNVQTALASVGHQYGNFNANSGIKAVADAAAKGDYAGAAKALQNMDPTYKNRRNEEAALMRA